MNRRITMRWTGILVALAALSSPSAASACGCFAPPDPANPVYQAGERILFSAHDGQVTAIIQIQYAGDAKDFGWLLPLPSVPTLEVSSDEVFASLVAGMAPSYQVIQKYDAGCRRGGGGGAGEFGGSDGPG